MNLIKNCSCHYEDKFHLWTIFCPLLIWKVSDVRFDCLDNRNRTQANNVSKWIALLMLYRSLFINHNYVSAVISAEQHAEQYIIMDTCTKICNKICNKSGWTHSRTSFMTIMNLVRDQNEPLENIFTRKP